MHQIDYLLDKYFDFIGKYKSAKNLHMDVLLVGLSIFTKLYPEISREARFTKIINRDYAIMIFGGESLVLFKRRGKIPGQWKCFEPDLSPEMQKTFDELFKHDPSQTAIKLVQKLISLKAFL